MCGGRYGGVGVMWRMVGRSVLRCEGGEERYGVKCGEMYGM